MTLPAKFFTALGKIESDNNDEAIGDAGKAIGRYQIHKPYWTDATQYDKTIGGCYDDCKKKSYAEKVVTAYLKRYGKRFIDSKDYVSLARIHNGGPSGHSAKCTEGYGKKFSDAFK